MHIYPPLLLLGAMLVSGCDAARLNESEGGIGGTGFVAGTVTATGNLTINGRSINATNAILLRNEVPQLSVEDTISVGEYVTLSTNEELSDIGQIDAQRIEYRSPVTGPVTFEGDNKETILVLGQRIKIDDLAILSGLNSVAELTQGDIVEVSGFLTEDTITATVLYKLNSNDNQINARVHGSIDAVNAENQSLMINDLQVEFGSAELVNLETSSLQIGLDIIVKGQVINSNQLIANTVIIDSTNIASPAGTRELFQGTSTSEREGRTLIVNNRTVLITDSTIIDDGVVSAPFSEINGEASSDITIGDRILVSATADGDGNAIADRLTIVRQGNLINLDGPIEDVSLPLNRIVVNGILVDVMANTLLIDSSSGVPVPLSFEDLRIGQSVQIIGNQTTSTRLTALRITRQN